MAVPLQIGHLLSLPNPGRMCCSSSDITNIFFDIITKESVAVNPEK